MIQRKGAANLGWLAALLLVLTGCVQTSDMPGHATGPTTMLPYRAVLVAGSDDTQAFDNAVARMRAWLVETEGARPAAITAFSATPAVAGQNGIGRADATAVMRRIANLRPDAGEGCFVFVTSHGVPERGVAMTASRQTIGPEVMHSALRAGCGDRPTVVIVSGCFSGLFAQPPMLQDNRIILTAARMDRPSFGCGVSDRYTYFDECLFDRLSAGPRWSDIYRAASACVSHKEAQQKVPPSMPQAWFGAVDATLAAPSIRR